MKRILQLITKLYTFWLLKLPKFLYFFGMRGGGMDIV